MSSGSSGAERPAGAIDPTRYVDGAAMLLAGLRRHHRFDDAAVSVPEHWRDFAQLAPVPGRCGTTTYGAVCGTAPAERTFEYLAGVEVASFDGLPAELGRMRVPAQRYAVFTHRGHVSRLQATWQAIWQEWLPRSGEHPANTPDFERYDDRFDPRTGQGEIEIWFPVAAPGQARWEAGAPAMPG